MSHHPELITGSVPLLIAVTGHKNLIPHEIADIRKRLKEQLVKRMLGQGVKRADVHLLTGLAEGSDTLMAELALELAIPLIAVLPMPKELYEEEFSTPETLARFQKLLGKAQALIQIPLEEGTSTQEVSMIANQRNFTLKRNRQYVALGRYLAATADVLVALWDGTPLKSNQVGGTANVVQLFRTRGGIDAGKLKHGALNPGAPGLLMHCKVSRQKQPPRSDAGLIQWTPSEDYRNEILHPSESIQDFLSRCMLRGAKAQSSKLPTAKDESQKEHRTAKRILAKNSLYKDIETSKEFFIPADARKYLTQRELDILHHFAEADSLANYFQQRRNVCLRTMLVLSIFASLCVCLFSDCPWPNPNSSLWLLGFFISFCSAYEVLAYKRGRISFLNWKFREDLETEYEDFRALAEGLRVQISWHLAGLPECVADHYLARQMDGLGKVSNMLRYSHLLLLSDPAPAHPSSDRDILVRKQWIDNQRNYFQTQVEGNSEKNRSPLRVQIKRRKRLSSRLFMLGLLMTAFLLFDSRWDFIPESLQWFVRGLMAFLPICAGVIRFHLEITGMEESAEQYERILAVYDKAIHLLDRTSPAITAYTPSLEKQDAYFHLGCEALSEHGDWLLFNRRKEAGPAS